MNQIQPPPPKKPLDQYRDALRVRQYSRRNEKTYLFWVHAYIIFHNKRHPKEMGVPEIRQYITHLVTEKKISGSTQNQAMSAILFLYRHVLHIQLDESAFAELRPQRGKTVPVVLSKEEANAVISNLTGVYKLVAQIMYGGGLRVMETLRLRVKDIDFANHQIVVRDGKGDNDRFTILPDSLILPLQAHLQQVKSLHEKDLKNGFGSRPKPRSRDAIICTKPQSKEQFVNPHGSPRSPSMSPRIPPVIPLRRICFKAVTISEQSKNCSDTRMSRRR